ncbi:hypothetical protein [Treponema zioleckii]|uniref:hypothetical protein n=1 Tax=Treponema zioleckii TaxID=331680 RepID=UPI00168B2A32|nr:hypothetical protein [Treponema zioleckii]
MPIKRDENYITDKVLVPLYNKSEEFRKFISNKFGNTVAFGDRLRTTCDERNDDDGNPDAKTTDEKLFIEVKINNNAKLTKNEREGGKYEQWLCEKTNHYLLYIVNDDFDMEDAVKHKRVKKICWKEIYDFIENFDNTAPELKILKDSVEGLAEKIPMDTETAQKEFLKFINNFNIKLIEEDSKYSPLKISKMGVYEEIDFWFTLENNNHFSGLDLVTGSEDLIYISFQVKDKKIEKELDAINELGTPGDNRNTDSGAYYFGICKTSDFLKNQEGRKEEENIKLFKKQINKVLNVLNN